jgi:hypothetical protein
MMAAAVLATAQVGTARADWVPPFKGNDTGGIIAWTLASEVDAHQLAVDHCARFGKVVKPLAAQRYYGGYISFACIWQRPRLVYPHAISVKD